MTDPEPLEMLLPLIDPLHDRNAFHVALQVPHAAGKRLHVFAPSAEEAAGPALAQRFGIAVDELDAVVSNAGGDQMVQAMQQAIDTRKQAMIVVAVRLRAGAHAPTPAQEHAWQMLERSRCPVLVVPPEPDMHDWHLRKELLPQDGTPGCAAALAQVVDRSREVGIANLVLRVAGARVEQPTEPGSLPTPHYVDHPQYEWEAWSQEFLARIAGQGTDLGHAGLKLLMARGEPALEILRVAQEESVDLIILPWHCATGSGRAQMVKSVLEKAACPVLLIPNCGAQTQTEHA